MGFQKKESFLELAQVPRSAVPQISLTPIFKVSFNLEELIFFSYWAKFWSTAPWEFQTNKLMKPTFLGDRSQ